MFKKYFKKIYKLRLRKLKSRYKKALRQEGEKYISILNHDIKTVILSQIQALELFLDNKAPREILYQTLDSNYFLYEIVQNSIFLSDFENNNHNLKLEDVDIAKITNDVREDVKNFANIKNQNIILKTNSKKIICSADRILINKIIHNLLTSSISYADENSDIEISIKEKKNTIEFSAKNKSVYMTKEKIKNIFKDKKLTDFNKLGMSLNLNIINKLVKRHNWNIIAKSSKDNSTVFGFIAKKQI